jgi:hypothetical protein
VLSTENFTLITKLYALHMLDCRRAEFSKYATRKLQVQDDNDPEQQRRDRERVLELMLSKEQVVSLIYAKSAAAVTVGSPQKATGFGAAGSPGAMDGMVNGLLDLNFGATPSWVSTAGSAHDAETSSPLIGTAGVEGDNSASHRGEFFADKLPAIAPPARK